MHCPKHLFLLLLTWLKNTQMSCQKYPVISLKSLDMSSQTAVSLWLKISAFVATKASGRFPDSLSNISSGFTLNTAVTLFQTVVSLRLKIAGFVATNIAGKFSQHLIENIQRFHAHSWWRATSNSGLSLVENMRFCCRYPAGTFPDSKDIQQFHVNVDILLTHRLKQWSLSHHDSTVNSTVWH